MMSSIVADRLFNLVDKLDKIRNGLEALYLVGCELHKNERTSGRAIHFLSENMLAQMADARKELTAAIRNEPKGEETDDEEVADE